MAKKSRKRPARPKKDNAGCMSGLISMFDFRQGRFTQKLLPDKKHGSGRHGGSVHSKNTFDVLSNLEDTHQDVSDTDTKEVEVDNSVKASIKVLMAEEMSRGRTSKRIPSSRVEQLRAELGFGDNLEKDYKRRPNQNYKGGSDHDVSDLTTSQSTWSDPSESSSFDVNLTELMVEFCRESHECQEKHIESNGERKITCLSEPNAQLTRRHYILQKALRDITDALLTQSSDDPKQAVGHVAVQPEEFMDAPETLNSNEDIFLKLLQDPNSLLFKHILDLQNAQTHEFVHVSKPEGSASCQPSLKQNKHNFSKKNDQSDGAKMSNESSSQALKRIVVLKPARHEDCSNTISPIPSPRASNLQHHEGTERAASHFSLKEIKRRLMNMVAHPLSLLSLMSTLKTHIFIFLISFILCLETLNSIAATFKPPGNFLLNCGANSSIRLQDGRVFQPDTTNSGSPYIFTPASRNVVQSDDNANTLDLCSTARIFTQPTKYSFNVQQKGRHFLRLHFCPIGKTATFSVTANGFTLLHNLSFSKLGLGQSVVLKEYVIEVGSDSEPLVLILAPSSGSIAFINAIEVIFLPENLFPATASSVSEGQEVGISSSVAFETLHRVNMGGPLVSAKNDSLWRDWVPDRRFLINPATARAVSTDPGSIRHSHGVSVYTAPSLVYATAQEMADANVGNQKFNISWVFDVDSGFSYLVRLHFCDFVSKNLRSLVFNVYINNQSALNSFDVSGKANGLSTAYFMDFVVEALIEKILIQVGPPQITTSSLPNAILNGLEIMKLSNSQGGLDRSLRENPIGVEVRKNKKLVVFVIASCVGGAALLGFLIAAFVMYFRHRKKTGDDNGGSTWLPSPLALRTHTGNSETKVSLGSFASSGPSLSFSRLFDFSEIREATKNFDESLVLGVGGFGKVYKGVIENGLVVAVKRGNPRSQQGLVEFRTEIDMLSKLRHRHLVSLIGYCHEPNEMVLVYDFMAGGSLRKHLYGSNLPALSWKQRLEICIGAAKGLHYLHTGAADTIIHRDVKTTNILLDESLTAKVSDFGLSKLGPAVDQTHVSTAVKGSFGYLDPEYFRRQQLTEKSDVYSFGVVLLEVLCARPAINPSLPRDQINIVEYALNWQKKGQLERVIDPRLVGTMSLDSLRKFGETAEKCLADYGAERPTMGDVLWNLEYALQLQESFTSSTEDGSSMNEIKEIPEWISEVGTINHDGFSVVSFRTDPTTSRVFSLLLDPKGR